MTPGLTIGATASHAMKVRESHLVPALFPETRPFAGMPPVFATVQTAAPDEWACVKQPRPLYETGKQSVGVHMDVDRRAPIRRAEFDARLARQGASLGLED